MTTEQFAWKVFCEAPIEFLRDELELKQKEVSMLFGKQIYDLILSGANKMTKKEKEFFINWNCESFNIELLSEELKL